MHTQKLWRGLGLVVVMALLFALLPGLISAQDADQPQTREEKRARYRAETAAAIELAGAAAAQEQVGAYRYTTLLSEGFEGSFPPPGWTLVDNAEPKSCNWASTATTGEINHTGGSGQAADANSDWCGYEMDAELRMPSLDLSAATTPALIFRTFFLGEEFGDQAYVDVSTNGGTSWTTELRYDGVDVPASLVTVDLSAYAGEANVLVRFRYVAADWHWYWQVDDVSIRGSEFFYVFLPLAIK